MSREADDDEVEDWGDDWEGDEDEEDEDSMPTKKTKAVSSSAAASSPSLTSSSAASALSDMPDSMPLERKNSFNVLEARQIHARQAIALDEVKDMLGVSVDDAAILLRHYRFDSRSNFISFFPLRLPLSRQCFFESDFDTSPYFLPALSRSITVQMEKDQADRRLDGRFGQGQVQVWHQARYTLTLASIVVSLAPQRFVSENHLSSLFIYLVFGCSDARRCRRRSR